MRRELTIEERRKRGHRENTTGEKEGHSRDKYLHYQCPRQVHLGRVQLSCTVDCACWGTLRGT